MASMAADPLPATLSFLTDAAHLLVSASPETSAHLMSQRNALMFNNHSDLPEVHRQHVCGCCGHIIIIGRGDRLEMESSKAARRKTSRTKPRAREAQPRGGCRKTLTCSTCGRYTKVHIPPPARISRRRPKPTPGPATTPVEVPGRVASSGEAPKVSANASSKKRAKNRKQGLQALLQQSASSKSQAGLGLSLADFMHN
ncbi:hypothetical protein F4802DRAFT_289208 [Xylaria palmicola]|nr:hypothetical protein F4802DRAFT_289208 [Xylaria palmicola]